MKAESFFSVVIVSSRRTPEKISLCLRSIFQGNYPKDSFEVIVVDSGSGEATLGYLRQEAKCRSNLRVILPAQGNIGPARGRNLGISAGRGELVAFTDDDIIVANDWLIRLADGYRRYPAVAGVGGITLPAADRLKNNLWAQYENFLYQALLKNKEGEYLSDKRDEHPAYTGNLSYRREILEKVGGFDESFSPLIYGEDGELKERVLQLDYRLLYVPVVNFHGTDYNWQAFWRREKRRGLGILFYCRRHSSGKPPRWLELIKMTFFPWVFFHKLQSGYSFKFSLIAVLAFWGRQWGKLEYYAQV